MCVIIIEAIADDFLQQDKVMGNEKGFSLIELIVSMAIFSVIMVAITISFQNLYKGIGQQTKSAATQIEGMVGLEMLRTDIASAGFALPWAFDSMPNQYNEVSNGGIPMGGTTDIGITSTAFDNLRDIPNQNPVAGSQNPPRAVVSSRIPVTGNLWTGPDYLVLKSALLALDNPSVGKWGAVNYATTGGTNVSVIERVSDPNTDVSSTRGDRVITIQSFFDPAGNQTKTLKMMADGTFSYAVPNNYQPPDSAFQPGDFTQVFYSYAISNAAALNMPYNRADYFINHSSNLRPASCNPGTGVLYKAVAGQHVPGDYTGANGALTYPLMNCVGDFKVVYYLDMNDDGNPGTYYMDVDPGMASDSSFGTNEGAGVTLFNIQQTLQNPALLRQRLKTVIVYVLAHEGQKDTSYNYPVTNPNTVITIGGNGAQKVWSKSQMSDAFGPDWFNYRWKVYNIPISMTNLQ